jgi:hypothetical protein
VTRSEEVGRPSTTRQTTKKVANASKATPRTTNARARRASSSSSTSTARKPTAAKQSPSNGETGEHPIVQPDHVVVDVEGPTWAETMATLAAPDELDPDDIAILTAWTQAATASEEVVDDSFVADHVAPVVEPIDDRVIGEPVVEPPITEAVPEPSTGLVAVTAQPGMEVGPLAAVATNPARAFTLWRRRRPRVRKVTRVVRRIDTWSVLKVSVLFYVVMFIILLVAGVLLWNLAESTGTVRNVEGFIRDLFNLEKFDVSGRELFRASWTLGVFLVIAGTGLNVTMAVLFNLISDLVGGIRVTVLEEEVVLAPRAPRVIDHRAKTALATNGETAPEQASEPEPVLPAESVDGS